MDETIEATESMEAAEPVEHFNPPAEFVLVRLREVVAQQNDQIVLLQATVSFQESMIAAMKRSLTVESPADSPEHEHVDHSHA